ncbi:MAG: hypothetical protein R2762_12110 [Bryobacteraceae bacterium]
MKVATAPAHDRFVYATMPLGANWLFTAAYLPGGEMAARLANFGALGLTAALIRNCTRSNLAAALYVSTPVLELVTGSLFVENTQAAFALAAAMAGGPVRGALLLGAAMMIKLSSLTFVAPLVLLLAWQHRRASWRRWGIAAGVFLLWALPAYVTAFARTGNPVFPLANAWFRSGGFGTNAMFTDPRFAQPLSWTTLYDLTFHSSRYFEGWDGAFGMQWLLAPLVILIPGAGRRTVAAGCVSAAAVLMTAPNLRYLTPALAMIAPAFGAIGARGWIAQAALLGCFAANLWLMPASSSWHRDSALNWLDSQAVTAYVLEHAPARALVAEMNREGAGKPVLFVENTHFAGLSGRAYSNSWYHYSFASRLEHADSTEAINELLRGSGIEYAVAPAPEAVPQWGLAELLDRQGRVVSRSGALRLYAIEREPRAAREVIVLGPGRYENDSAGLRFSGSWRRQGGFADASSGSVTYSEVTGATARIRFRGTGLRWIFTRAPNRGLARVRVDGGAAREVDLHAADVAWQASYSVTELPAGEHEAVIEVGGRGFVDVDAVEVAGESAP